MWIWVCYLLGQFLNTLLRATAIIQSPLSGIASYRQFALKHAPVIAVRVFASVMLMLIGQQSPVFSQITEFVGKTAGNAALAGVAGISGLGIDTLLDKLSVLVPALRRDVPPPLGK